MQSPAPAAQCCVCRNVHQQSVFVLQAAGVDVECSLQTAALEFAVGRRPSDRRRQPTRPVGQIAVVGGTRRLRQQLPFLCRSPNASLRHEAALAGEPPGVTARVWKGRAIMRGLGCRCRRVAAEAARKSRIVVSVSRFLAASDARPTVPTLPPHATQFRS
jgi:hypothetical protein